MSVDFRWVEYCVGQVTQHLVRYVVQMYCTLHCGLIKCTTYELRSVCDLPLLVLSTCV